MSMNGQGMRGLLGREVKINRGGPDAVQGTLMDVRWDYMAMNCKEGIVYVNESHVKSITDTGRSGGNQNMMGNPIPSNTFLGVMQALRFRHVQINRGGPEKVEGILADANQNQLILTMKNQEIVRIPMQHVKSVSLVRGNSNNNNNSNNSNSNNNNTSQGNQSQNNQSRGNRSQGNQAAQGNQNNGNQSRGNQSRGNQGQGNKSGGNKSRGNQGQGNKSGGNKSRGNQGQGNKSGGNKSRGNQGQGNKSGGNKSGGKR